MAHRVSFASHMLDINTLWYLYGVTLSYSFISPVSVPSFLPTHCLLCARLPTMTLIVLQRIPVHGALCALGAAILLHQEPQVDQLCPAQGPPPACRRGSIAEGILTRLHAYARLS